MAKRRSGTRISHGLTALSSAAVLAVYSAGYLRTKAAADRFDDESTQRRRPAPQPIVPEAPLPSSDVAASATTFALPTRPRPTDDARSPGPSASAKASADRSGPGSSAPAAAPAAAVDEPKPAEPVATAPAVVTAPAAATAPATTAATPAPAATTTATVTAEPARKPGPYKDGTYLGWGHCRHGDIQAAVKIDNGYIVSATVAQCLTRYSCSWISPLPPQVVARQSPETDFVSGATDSTNAFYYALVEALKQAK